MVKEEKTNNNNENICGNTDSTVTDLEENETANNEDIIGFVIDSTYLQRKKQSISIEFTE